MACEVHVESLHEKRANAIWATVLHLGVRQTYPAGYLLDLSGSSLTDFYYIEKGRLVISYASQSGRELPILTLGSGNLFNVSSALTGFDNADSSYLVSEATVLWCFQGSLLSSPDFVRQYPELIINLMRSLAEKTLHMHETLSYTGPDTALISLARWLCHMADERGTTFSPGLTQQEIANKLGVHRATLVRCVHNLRKEGLIGRFSRSSLEIIDLAALRKIVSG